jgi:hypothetical protein
MAKSFHIKSNKRFTTITKTNHKGIKVNKTYDRVTDKLVAIKPV